MMDATLGILAGALLAITAIWWIPFFRVWSLLYIIIGLVVVYAATEHAGRDDTPSDTTTTK